MLQLCHGGALNERIKKQDPELTWLQRLQIAVAIARALEYLHSINMVHRDVKTQVCGHGYVKYNISALFPHGSCTVYFMVMLVFALTGIYL